METHSSSHAGESQGQSNLTGYSQWGHKESNLIEATELGPAGCKLHQNKKDFFPLIHQCTSASKTIPYLY